MEKLQWMTLLFVAVGKQPVTQGLLSGKAPDPDDYYIVRRLPLIEMLTKDPVSMMEEIIAMTADADWREQTRRSIDHGDVLMFGDEPWMLMHGSDPLAAMAKPKPLPGYKEFCITPLKPEQFKGLICKPVQLTT